MLPSPGISSQGSTWRPQKTFQSALGEPGPTFDKFSIRKVNILVRNICEYFSEILRSGSGAPSLVRERSLSLGGSGQNM